MTAMMGRWVRALSMLALLGAAGAAICAEPLKATLERNPVHAGESVRLVLELERAPGGLKPDLSPLERDFEVLHVSANTQIEFVQGVQSTITRWVVELVPRREGMLTLPALSVGRFRSPQTTLEVLPARQSAPGGDRDIFLEAEITPNPAYVQAQMRYVVRLLRAVDVVDGTLTEPNAKNCVLRRLGRDVSYTTTRDGRSYRVLERRYALFPQVSGELVVSPVQFEGEVVDPGQAGTGLSRLFARGKRVRLKTPVVRATALAPPQAFHGAPWLPAKSLELSEEWSKNPDALHAGEPVTRTIRIEALGLSADQLPEITVASSEGFKAYGDQPITRTSVDTDWVHGGREQRIALVPGRPGHYTLPEIRIDWWDTERNTARQAIIAERRIEVAAAPGDAPAQAAAQPAVQPTALGQPPAAVAWQGVAFWQALAGALVLVWAVTFVAWRRAREAVRARGEGRDGAAEHGPPVSLRRACLDNDAPAARTALLRWAEHAWPANAPRNLVALAERLGDDALGAEIARLDRALYAGDPGSWQGKSLWRLARRALTRPAAPKPPAADSDDLPQLYLR